MVIGVQFHRRGSSGILQGSGKRKAPGTRGYGVDEPRTIAELGVAGLICVALGVLVSSYTITSAPKTADTAIIAGPGVGFLIFVVAAALYWSSRLGKVKEMSKIVNDIPWGGEEVVLDLGCGRGLAMVMAAKKLTTGFALGIDTWSAARLSGNDPRSIGANAEQEGVESKVTAAMGFSAQLPLADKSVDVVLSAASLHHLVPRKQRGALFAEVARVLKDGGRIGILDAGNGPEYSALLNRSGLRDVQMHRIRFSGLPPFHIVIARKPYRG
jgi:arsenite methyltransferase